MQFFKFNYYANGCIHWSAKMFCSKSDVIRNSNLRNRTPIQMMKVWQYPITNHIDLLVQKNSVLAKKPIYHPYVCPTAYDCRRLHVSCKRRVSLSFLLMIIRNGMKLSTILLGRRTRTWWSGLSDIRRRSLIERLWRNMVLLSALLALVTTGIVYFYVSHLQEDPITKRKRFIALTTKQMMELTRPEQESLALEFQDFYLKTSHPTYKRIADVTYQILNANIDLEEVRSRNWMLIVIEQPEMRNAFVLPDGSIYLFTGLLDLCKNDDQLGIILCHEISHALLRHLAEQLSRLYLGEILFLVPIFVIWSLLPDYTAIFVHFLASVFTKVVFHLPFSRFTEIEADGLGLSLAARACFDVREASAFWKKMHLLAGHRSAGAIHQNVEWISTHPSYKSRERFLDKLMPLAINIRKNSDCPELSENDPRKNIPAMLQELIDILKKIESNVK